MKETSVSINHGAQNGIDTSFEEITGEYILKGNFYHDVAFAVSDVDAIPEKLIEDMTLFASHQYKKLIQKFYIKKYGDESNIEQYGHPEYAYLINYDGERRAITIRGYFASYDDVTKKIKQFKECFPKEKPVNPSIVSISFWSAGATAPNETTRKIKAPSWDDIKCNYPASINLELEEIMKMKPSDTLSGSRLMLWRGDPGTGKTWAIRSLAMEWRDWCNVHYVIDPERFFGDANYMIGLMNAVPKPNDNNEAYRDYGDIITGDDYIQDENIFNVNKPIWNLLILEDSGNFISLDASQRSDGGQALSKLLNLSDGLLGQGINLMILITTNEELDKIHVAVSREGRCLSNLSFGAFTKDEAIKWLQQKNHDFDVEDIPQNLILANLYSKIGKKKHATIKNAAPSKRMGFR